MPLALRRRVAGVGVLEEVAQPDQRRQRGTVVFVPRGQLARFVVELAQPHKAGLDLDVRGRAPAAAPQVGARSGLGQPADESGPLAARGIAELAEDLASDRGEALVRGGDVASHLSGDLGNLGSERLAQGAVARVEGGARVLGPAVGLGSHRGERGADIVTSRHHQRQLQAGVVDLDRTQRGGAGVARLGGRVDGLRAGDAPQQLGLVVRQHVGRGIDGRLDRVLTQQPQRERVDGADRGLVHVPAIVRQRRVGHHRAAHALAHLGGGGR